MSGTSQGTAQRVTVGVAATAMLRIDAGGSVVAAWTNTGCAPRPGDDVYVMLDDGTIERGSAELIAGRTWHGDFGVAGRFVTQRQPSAPG